MQHTDPPHKPLVAVAGASGFVGTHLRRQLSDLFDFRALSRSSHVVEHNVGEQTTQWRECDLYSLPKLSQALVGCDYAIYLVHSMAPSSRMLQGDFEDTDLLLADNFIRAAEEAGIRHVIYLSGLMPESVDGAVSTHLRSRCEVERSLRSRSVPVTVLRAGLIFGAGGSSFSMLVNLVRRLPLMFLPAWVDSKTHSIDIDNVCQAFRLCLRDPLLRGGIYDLGGHQPMTYREMILKTGQLLGRPVRTIDLSLNLFSISKYLVAYFSGVSSALVGPLLASLQHDLKARPNVLLERMSQDMISFEQSFYRAVDAEGMPLPNPRSHTQRADKQHIKRARRVRSVQRMPLPLGWDAHQIAVAYGGWLTRRFGGWIDAEKDAAGVLRFYALGRKVTLLELTPTPYCVGGDRCAFYISGGVLSRKVDPPGRFEFRLMPTSNCLIASIHGFAPTLPWWFYARTQAVAHLRVMRGFARYLGSL
ncbi:MAG: hypothetical protein ACI81V_000352 [Lentimonas sp.]|jgi:uncharacterized protein YbjT (DUF2867 family)